jgi:hypothetical protein
VDSVGEEAEGEEARWDGFRPTGGAAFLDIELVDDAAERRRSSFFATSCDAELAGLMVEAGILFKDVCEKLLASEATEAGSKGGGSFRVPFVGRGFGGGGANVV